MNEQNVVIGSIGFGAFCSMFVAYHIWRRKPQAQHRTIDCDSLGAYSRLIGNTPLVELRSLSKLTGRRVYAKMENMNPGGTGKDRAARRMLLEGLKERGFSRDTVIVEGTSGSTGIALACQCLALGLKLIVVMPDDQAAEKATLLERLGASVTLVPNCGIANKDHYVNAARRLAEQVNGVFINQFENLANFRVHFEETGPEIWEQLCGKVDGFVMSAGTGGTIAGVSRFLKQKNPNVHVCLADPVGSSLFSRVEHGVCFTEQQVERKLKKHRYDTIVEGVGLDRVTANFQEAVIDSAEKIGDQELVEMAHWILREEGLFVGSSSALNLVGTVRLAAKLHPGSSVVTIICDGGHRHLSRFWNKDFYEQNCSSGIYPEIRWPAHGSVPKCLQELKVDANYCDTVT